MIRPTLLLLVRPSTIIAVVLACASAGCVTTQVSGGKPGVGSKTPQPFPGDAMNALDPCADQMHDLCGALITYDLVKHSLPARLEEVQQFADAGQDLKFTCPVTGKPYVYSRAGLEAPGRDIRIYVYDAAPAHVFHNPTSNIWSNKTKYGKTDPADGGSRMCICSKPGATTGATTALFSDEIPERAFKQFAPISGLTPEPPQTPTNSPQAPPPAVPSH